MEKSIDLIVTDFKEQIVKVINESQLPITIIQMILHEITGFVDMQAQSVISNQRKKYELTPKKEIEENKS